MFVPHCGFMASVYVVRGQLYGLSPFPLLGFEAETQVTKWVFDFEAVCHVASNSLGLLSLLPPPPSVGITGVYTVLWDQI